MSRSDLDRLYDIAEAIAAIRSHVAQGPLSEAVVLDAVRMRLLEIGEAVKGLSEELTAREPAISITHTPRVPSRARSRRPGDSV